MNSPAPILTYSLDQPQDVTLFINQLKSLSQTNSLKDRVEVILHSKGFSRIGKMELAACQESAELLNRAGVACFFQWDILMVETTFLATCALFKTIDFTYFSGIRVQDPGALYFLKEENCAQDIHFITDQGNHNTLGLKSWVDYWPAGIKRLVISPEIPSDAILELHRELNIDLEVLGAGSILLFYTPRHLVSPLYGEEGEGQGELQGEWKEDSGQSLVWGTSEESPHKGFPIVENQHGTFMYNTKEVLIFDEAEAFRALEKTQRVVFRVDYLLEPLSKDGLTQFFFLINQILNDESENSRSGKQDWKLFAQEQRSLGVTKGFFRTNKTDVLFKKLKSSRLQDELTDLIGEVVDVKKKKHIGIRLSSCDTPLKRGEEIELTSPDGNIKRVTVSSMKNADGVELTEGLRDRIIFIPHVGGISVKTQVCRLEKLSPPTP